ncbi:MAG: hypothetical protein Q4F21_13240 [Lachnospiraceae bacterium]|nr:hypothetical protein [Lachnospiraceae bacterium]
MQTNLSVHQKKNFVKTAVFLLILFLMLKFFSDLSLYLNRNPDPLLHSDSHGILAEPKDSIDVVAIGNSNVRSGITPLNWWNEYGFTGYTWGEASQRIYNSRFYLQEIFKKQSPKLVLLEASCFFRDSSLAEELDSIVRANISNYFPVIMYHHNLMKLTSFDPEIFHSPARSLPKGYRFSNKHKASKDSKSYMSKRTLKENTHTLHPLVKQEILKIRQLCEDNNAQLLILTLPSTGDWNLKYHKLVNQFCTENKLDFLDMNKRKILHSMHFSWKYYTRDRGIHLNYEGASTATSYLGNYLTENYQLPDHRNDKNYQQWNEDFDQFLALIRNADETEIQ